MPATDTTIFTDNPRPGVPWYLAKAAQGSGGGIKFQAATEEEAWEIANKRLKGRVSSLFVYIKPGGWTRCSPTAQHD